MVNNCCGHFSVSLLFLTLSHTHRVFYKDLWYSVAQSMWIKQEGLLLISKNYRKWAQSPIEHFQLEVQPLCLAGLQLSSYSLTRREMEIERRYYITRYFPISVSLLMLLAKPLLFHSVKEVFRFFMEVKVQTHSCQNTQNVKCTYSISTCSTVSCH